MVYSKSFLKGMVFFFSSLLILTLGYQNCSGYQGNSSNNSRQTTALPSSATVDPLTPPRAVFYHHLPLFFLVPQTLDGWVDVVENSCNAAEPPRAANSAVCSISLFMGWRRAESFVRIINLSKFSGTINIFAISDGGKKLGPVTLSIEANKVAHLNSSDLSHGNSDKGLSGGLMDGVGWYGRNYQLLLDTELRIQPLVFSRTRNGSIASIDKVESMWAIAINGSSSSLESNPGDAIPVPTEWSASIPFFNPSDNLVFRSQLRLTNPTSENASIVIKGVDDNGQNSSGKVTVTLRAGKSKMFRSRDLENGVADRSYGDVMIHDPDSSGALGDGHGKWQLFVTSSKQIQIMNLMQGPMGLTNLSPAVQPSVWYHSSPEPEPPREVEPETPPPTPLQPTPLHPPTD